ncbi:hypothetical protein, partial [Salinispora arenicola]|uniref:hypothetical protein n=1 Tax=Salinispora arenicola TaxID=168697 RepID=UPI00037C7F00
MTEPMQEPQVHEPVGAAVRQQVTNLTVLASFAEAVARWRYAQQQRRAEEAEQQARRAQLATRAAEQAEAQQRRDDAAVRRFNAAQHRAASAVFTRAESTEFLVQADTSTLGETWAAAAAYHRTDPQAASAMDRVEIRLRVLHPDAMATYDLLRSQGAGPQDAMAKAVQLMDPDAVVADRGPGARAAYRRAGELHGEAPSGGDLVPAHALRSPVGVERVAHLRALEEYLGQVAASSPNGVGASGIAETRRALRQDIESLDVVLRSGGSTPSVTATFGEAMDRWVRLETPTAPTAPGTGDDPVARINEIQRRVAAATYSRAFVPSWLEDADVRALGETWAAAAAYPGDRRAVVALDRVEQRLRGSQPAAMQVYDVLRGEGELRQEAMLRAAPLMEPGRAPLSPGEAPQAMAAARIGTVFVPPNAEPMAPGRAGQEQMHGRLQELSRHLGDAVDVGPPAAHAVPAVQKAAAQWREQVSDTRRMLAAAGAQTEGLSLESGAALPGHRRGGT